MREIWAPAAEPAAAETSASGEWTSRLPPPLRALLALPLIHKLVAAGLALSAATALFAVWLTTSHLENTSSGAPHWEFFLALLSGGLLVLIAVSYAIVRVALFPIHSLGAAMERLRTGDLSARAPAFAATDSQMAQLVDTFNAMAASLEEQQRRLVWLSSEALNAQEEERRRVARELHDDTGQALTSILLGLRRLENQAADPALRQELASLRGVVSGALDDVRRISRNLRPSVLDDLGLVAALQSLAADIESHAGLKVVTHLPEGAARLEPRTEVVLYRIAQEALTNVLRHAGATRAELRLELSERAARLEVADDGGGFDPSQVCRGIGLFGMFERASMVGGSLRIEPSPRGTRVVAEVPR